MLRLPLLTGLADCGSFVRRFYSVTAHLSSESHHCVGRGETVKTAEYMATSTALSSSRL